MNAPLLIELFTEELPPKALRRLTEAFGQGMAQGLIQNHLAPADAKVHLFGTPRRLAVRITAVERQGPDQVRLFKGPSVAVGLDAQGQPTLALQKWAAKQGTTVEQLSRSHDGKQDCFVFRTTTAGATLTQLLPELMAQVLSKLPIPKLMHYPLADGRTHVSFVRPAHGLVVMHGPEVIPVSVLGLESGARLHGHRFLGTPSFDLTHAQDYEKVLAQEGRVVASFTERRARIEAALRTEARAMHASLGDEAQMQTLLDEVTALVEWPAVYVGQFDPEFLHIPQECLILTMRTHQKYFPLFNDQGGLQARFLIVSNMEVTDPALIIDGNQRVVRPRLADARFFFEQDQKTRLIDRVPQLAHVVYHAKLGTQAQRTERVRALAGVLAQQRGLNQAAAERAALLAKTDLLTAMVGEFPELQGTMGNYYARHDGEDPAIAQAIAEHYQPRAAGAPLPASALGTVLALADKLETLVGMWGIGAHPTGDRDPFALRRHALGVLRMLSEPTTPGAAIPSLRQLLATTAECLATVPSFKPDIEGVHDFMVERLRGWLRERGHTSAIVEAVLAHSIDPLSELEPKLHALAKFLALPEASSLASANKRISHILRKAETPFAPDDLDPTLFNAAAEHTLHAALTDLQAPIAERLTHHDYVGALSQLASLRAPVDTFFAEVMVNVPDAGIRQNRLALLHQLHRLMNQVADLSLLAT